MHNEARLLQSFCSGEYSSSVEILIRQHEDNLYNLCYKLTMLESEADDLYQQTWLRAIQKANTFSGKSLKNWLYTICLNTYRDNYRKNKRRAHIENTRVNEDAREYALEVVTDNVSAENIAMKNLLNDKLAALVDMLPDKHRIPLILYYFEGLDYKESAAALGLPIGTIKSRLSYAKKKLRREMEKELDV